MNRLGRAAWRYIYGLLIALDQVGNAILGGYPDETLSIRAERSRKRGARWACILCRALEAIHPGHCRQAARRKAISLARRA